MKRLLAVTAFVTLGLAACGGSDTLGCQTYACATGTKSYKTCVENSGDVRFEYGGASCSCDAGDGPDCMACEQKAAAYCGS